MRTGLPVAPSRKLNPQLRQAVRLARQHGQRLWTLAVLADFAQPCQLSTALHAPTIRATPLMLSRLERLAEAVHFYGDLFLPDETEGGR